MNPAETISLLLSNITYKQLRLLQSRGSVVLTDHTYRRLVKEFDYDLFMLLEASSYDPEIVFTEILRLESKEPELLDRLIHELDLSILNINTSYLLTLPNELLLEIIKNRTVKDILSFCKSDSSFNYICSPDGWRHIYIAKYQLAWDTLKQHAKYSYTDNYYYILLDIEKDGISYPESQLVSVIYTKNRNIKDEFIKAGIYEDHLIVMKWIVDNKLNEIKQQLTKEDIDYILKETTILNRLDVIKYLVYIVPVLPIIGLSVNDNYIIENAADYGYLDIVEYVVSIMPYFIGIDPFADHYKAIRYAAMNFNLDIVEYLMSLACHKLGRTNCTDIIKKAIKYIDDYGHLESIEHILQVV